MLAENTDNEAATIPQMMDFTPEEILYALQFERTLRELEAHLHNTDDPEVIAKDMLVAAMEFYDGDWCGVFDVDLTMKVWTPILWYAVALRSEIWLSPKFQKNGGTQMFNSKNSYALNKKDANAIVYIDADGNITRLTRACFSSEEEFLKWKSWSDADYHASEKRDHVHANHTLALDELSEEAAFVPAMDVIMELELDRQEQIAYSAKLVVQIRACLSETQFRRVWMYFVDGMTLDEIGKKEGTLSQLSEYQVVLAFRFDTNNEDFRYNEYTDISSFIIT